MFGALIHALHGAGGTQPPVTPARQAHAVVQASAFLRVAQAVTIPRQNRTMIKGQHRLLETARNTSKKTLI